MNCVQREIRFRVWDSKGQRYLDRVPGEEYMLDTDEWHHPDDDAIFLWQTAQTFGGRLIWEQFTGLLDKEGKPIYENDIVQTYVDPPEGDPFYSYRWVVWDDRNARFGTTVSRHKPFLIAAFWANGLSDYIVGGNVHEHPELLHKT